MVVPATARASILRPAPPPRELTAQALVRGLSVAQRLIGPASLLLALGLMVEVATRSGRYFELLVLVLWWFPAFVTSVQLARRPSMRTAAAMIVVGAVAGTGYVATILQSYSEVETRGVFLVEALAWALMFTGAVRPSAIDGIRWVLAGLVAGTASLIAGYLIAGQPVALSPDRLTDASIMIAAYAVIAIGSRRRRDRVPVLPEAALVSRRQNAARQRERAASALVHDTVLASLTLIERSGAELDDRVRWGIRRDLDAVARSTATSEGVVSAAATEGSLGGRLLAVADEFRWRGMRVDLAGAETIGDLAIADHAAEALLAAATAALDNVLRHAGTDRAEVAVGRTPSALTIMVVDAGRGFDTGAVPDDRLGVRESIMGRLSRVGGTARLWSNSSGTTVMLTVPLGAPAGAS